LEYACGQAGNVFGISNFLSIILEEIDDSVRIIPEYAPEISCFTRNHSLPILLSSKREFLLLH
jgi:hypothetical protein